MIVQAMEPIQKLNVAVMNAIICCAVLTKDIPTYAAHVTTMVVPDPKQIEAYRSTPEGTRYTKVATSF